AKPYAFRTRSTDKPPYREVSPWSAWCQFEVDTLAPPVTASVVTAPGGPGEIGVFQISTTASDVTAFKYGWDAPTKQVAVPAGGKSVTVSVMVPRFGRNVLQISAVDKTLNEGFGSVELLAGRPAPAVASWGLETNPRISQAQAFADRQPDRGGNTPLTGA